MGSDPLSGLSGDSKRIASPVLAIFFSLFLAAGLLVVYQASKRVARNYALVHSGLKTQGNVIDYRQSSGKDARIWPVVKFVTPDERTVTFESLYHPKYSGYSIGGTVPVVYDPHAPEIAEIDEPERLWGGLAVSYLVGIVFTIVGAGALAVVMRRRPAT